MPVKVRCSGCKRVLNAPDAARGKVIKCPQCETKVKVPSEKAPEAAPAEKATPVKATSEKATAKKKKKAVAAGSGDADLHSDDMLADLDLSDAEHAEDRVCPKCAAELEEDAKECPSCGIDLETGKLSKQRKKKMSIKGPDPAEFFTTAWKDAWKFMVDHKKFAFRTSLYTGLPTLFSFGCLLMTFWVSKWPPRAFWTLLCVVFAIAPLGWFWFLNTEIIRLVVDKREQLGRIHFDVFLSMALGIKTFAWQFAVLVQLIFPLVGIGLIATGNLPVVGFALLGVGFLMLVMLLPITMSHMVMPVTIRGWMPHAMLPALFKSLKGDLYWCLILFVTTLPLLGTTAIVGVVSGSDMGKIAGTLAFNSQVKVAKAAKEWADSENAQVSKEVEALAKNELKAPEWKVLILPGCMWAVNVAMVGFIAVYNMRTNAMFFHYFRRSLNLVTQAKEVKYVSKASMTPEEIAKQKNKRATIMLGAIVGGVLVLGGIYLLATHEATATAPTDFERYAHALARWELEKPTDWGVTDGGGQEGVDPWVRLKAGGALVMIRQIPIGPTQDELLSKDASANPGMLTGDDKLSRSIDEVHESKKEAFADQFGNYKEAATDRPQMKHQRAQAMVTQFSATEGLFSRKVIGYRVTVIHQVQITVQCQCGEKNWATLKPVFERIIQSVQAKFDENG